MAEIPHLYPFEQKLISLARSPLGKAAAAVLGISPLALACTDINQPPAEVLSIVQVSDLPVNGSQERTTTTKKEVDDPKAYPIYDYLYQAMEYPKSDILILITEDPLKIHIHDELGLFARRLPIHRDDTRILSQPVYYMDTIPGKFKYYARLPHPNGGYVFWAVTDEVKHAEGIASYWLYYVGTPGGWSGSFTNPQVDPKEHYSGSEIFREFLR